MSGQNFGDRGQQKGILVKGRHDVHVSFNAKVLAEDLQTVLPTCPVERSLVEVEVVVVDSSFEVAS